MPLRGMKFKFENLGPIDNAELELGDLTVIAGRNNTGKTYLAHTVYGFLSEFYGMMFVDAGSNVILERLCSNVGIDEDDLAHELMFRGSLEWKVSYEDFLADRSRVLSSVCSIFSKEKISEMFSGSSYLFRDFRMGIEIGHESKDSWQSGKPKDTVLRSGNMALVGTFDGSTYSVLLSGDMDNEDDSISPYELLSGISELYVDFLLGDYSESFISPRAFVSERSFIHLFYKDLDFAKNQAMVELRRIRTEGAEREHRWHEVIDRMSRYTIPFQDAIDMFREFERPPTGRPAFSDPLIDRLESMMEGKFVDDEDGGWKFIVSGHGSDVSLSPHLVSSSVSELILLYLFLKKSFFAKRSFFIIDEPESHLDTTNQIEFARILARMVQIGIKVLITTHSDYIVKELNNLIMLHNDFENRQEVIERLGYTESLDPDMVCAYVAEKGTLTKCDLDKYGIDMPHFDRTIDSINAVSNELTGRLSAEEEDL